MDNPDNRSSIRRGRHALTTHLVKKLPTVFFIILIAAGLYYLGQPLIKPNPSIESEKFGTVRYIYNQSSYRTYVINDSVGGWIIDTTLQCDFRLGQTVYFQTSNNNIQFLDAPPGCKAV
jgi:hypothetical protein